MSRSVFASCFLSFFLLISVGCGSSTPEKVFVPEPPVAQFAMENPAPGTPPETILFDSGYGDVTYTHRKHVELVNGNCATCHPSVFPQELKVLDYGKARHRSAEEFKTSCAACHGISGSAFAAERNCQRCHDMKSKQ